MTAVSTSDGERGRGDGLDDAWAQIVAGYGPEPDERAALDAEATSGTAAEAVRHDEEGHYVPPAPPPLPRPVGVVGAAWVALLGGPSVLLVATVLGWDLPVLVTAVCVLGFVGGLVFLITQLDDGRDEADGWDNGAQV